jgi:DNA-binding NarL/FixJ family response regulator
VTGDRMITVVVVDDEVLLRSGLASLVESADDLTVVAEASDGVDAVAVVQRVKPDVVLMDIRMPQMDGLEATRRIVADPANASTRVLILTTFDHDEYVYEALRVGASGFLLKSAMPEDLRAAVRVIASGDGLLAPSVTRRLIEDFASRPESSSLARPALAEMTDREQDVLTAVAKGLSNAEICATLHMSLSTAKTHISHLLLKLGARDRTQLVVLAYEAGFAVPGAP